MNGLDLFSGIGGVSQALGPWVRTVAYCENDRFAQSVLLSRMGRGEIDTAPIWDDVQTLKGADLPPIDIITGGWPCQGNSAAGLRKGMDDERSKLVVEVIRLVGELRPRYVFLENVPGVLTAPGDGLGYVLRELARLGYDVRWTLLSAAEVGATHKRDRFWLLAHCDQGGRGAGGSLQESGYAEQLIEEAVRPVADTEGGGARRNGGSFQHADGGQEPGLLREPDGPVKELGDTERKGRAALGTVEPPRQEPGKGHADVGHSQGPRLEGDGGGQP